MKKQILTLVIASMVIGGCNSDTKKESSINSTAISDGIDTNAVDKVPGADMHTAQISLDWNGTYKGITPCADCEGIETEITLNKDMTFLIKTKYQGKEDKTFEEAGNFKWDKKGSIVILEGLKNQAAQFFVGENTLTQLDMDGKRITGELASNYMLKKVGLE